MISAWHLLWIVPLSAAIAVFALAVVQADKSND